MGSILAKLLIVMSISCVTGTAMMLLVATILAMVYAMAWATGADWQGAAAVLSMALVFYVMPGAATIGFTGGFIWAWRNF